MKKWRNPTERLLRTLTLETIRFLVSLGRGQTAPVPMEPDRGSEETTAMGRGLPTGSPKPAKEERIMLAKVLAVPSSLC